MDVETQQACLNHLSQRCIEVHGKVIGTRLIQTVKGYRVIFVVEVWDAGCRVGCSRHLLLSQENSENQ